MCLRYDEFLAKSSRIFTTAAELSFDIIMVSRRVCPRNSKTIRYRRDHRRLFSAAKSPSGGYTGTLSTNSFSCSCINREPSFAHVHPRELFPSLSSSSLSLVARDQIHGPEPVRKWADQVWPVGIGGGHHHNHSYDCRYTGCDRQSGEWPLLRPLVPKRVRARFLCFFSVSFLFRCPSCAR